MKHTEPNSGPQAGLAGADAHWTRVMARAWRRRCPRCGEGDAFESAFRLRHTCSECELVMRPQAGGMTGQMYLVAAVSEVLAIGMAVILFLVTDWNVWVTLAVIVPCTAIFSYWFLPKGMALWAAVDYLTDRYETAHTPDGPKGEGSRKKD